MEFLTKSIQKRVELGSIKGIKLARTSPPLTHVMYADDLVIMGQATGDEINNFQQILEEFGRYSGLLVNPKKSKVWVSRECDEQCTNLVVRELRAAQAENQEKYLGVFLNRDQLQHRNTHELLIEKIHSRLAGWKVNLLSHAGRAVMIRSVLMSIPVYCMSVEKLPKKTVGEINGIMRKFLWGKLGKERYLSLIAWHKVCQPYEEGGLEIRVLQIFNEALILKMVWQLASNQDKIWVQVMRGKYFPRKGFWGVNTTRRTSKLWKAIQEMKPNLLSKLKWHIGDGTTIPAINQPWFEGWNIQEIYTNVHLNMKVGDLFDQVSQRWKTTLIDGLFGEGASQIIEASTKQPTDQPLISDRLIWTEGKGGTYTAKEGYFFLAKTKRTTPVYDQNTKQAWGKIWKWKGVIPRVQTFIWRVLHGGIATSQTMHMRINGIDPKCQLCGRENEFIMHTLFFYTRARATWFASPFSIRVDELPMQFAETLLAMTRNMNQEEVVFFCNILWNIWKARNESLYKEDKATPTSILARANALKYDNPGTGRVRQPIQQQVIEAGYYAIQVDGS